jgi:hypothetical protein
VPNGSWSGAWDVGDTVPMTEYRKGVGAIFDSTLGSAQASFDLSSIPSSYGALIIALYARGDTAASATGVNLRFNNDSAANYDFQTVAGSAATASSGETFASTSASIGNMPAATAVGNLFSDVDVVIPHYAGSTNNKVLFSMTARKTSTTTGTMQVSDISAFWRSNAAINRVTILPAAGNFVAGSRCTIYVAGA